MTGDGEAREYGFYMLPVLPPGVDSMEVGALGRTAAASAAPWFAVDGGKLPYPVYMKLGRDQDGRLAIVGLHIDGTERWQEYGPLPRSPESITAASLRLVGSAIIDVLRSIAEHRMEDETMRVFIGPLLDRSAEPYAGVALRPGRGGHPQEFYREVAEAFAELHRERVEHPYKVMSAKFYKSESQARRLVAEALRRFPEMKPKDGGKR